MLTHLFEAALLSKAGCAPCGRRSVRYSLTRTGRGGGGRFYSDQGGGSRLLAAGFQK
jgi:hypothetical protein